MARSEAPRAGAGLLLLLALLAGPLSPARADGDPASDYLIANQVFLTSQSVALSPAQRTLVATVRAANRAGLAIRVAVISNQYDLGSITALWRKPSLYARFLGIELSGAYRQRLLVAMPNGFGFNWPGHSSAATDRLLAGVRLGAGGDGLSVAATAAVQRLAAADGVKLAPIKPTAGTARSRPGGDTLAIAGGVLGGLAVLSAIALAVRWGWRRGRRRSTPARIPLPLRWALPPVAMLLVAAVALAVAASRRGPQVSVASVVTPPPITWPAGRQPAPGFVLHDQTGRPVSLAAYGGRPVIVTFIDPLCRNLCPLEAQVLNQLERQLPAPQRPAILAVSVDVYSNANSRANLLQSIRQWHLVPQWRWAVGRPSQLAAVWKRYEIGVSVVTRRIAGTTIHYITHTEEAYVIDATGHERALFVWPFYPPDVKRVLARLA